MIEEEYSFDFEDDVDDDDDDGVMFRGIEIETKESFGKSLEITDQTSSEKPHEDDCNHDDCDHDDCENQEIDESPEKSQETPEKGLMTESQEVINITSSRSEEKQDDDRRMDFNPDDYKNELAQNDETVERIDYNAVFGKKELPAKNTMKQLDFDLENLIEGNLVYDTSDEECSPRAREENMAGFSDKGKRS